MTGVFYAVDGSRMRYDTNTATLYLPDGTRYILGGSFAQFIDRNGNTQNFSYNSSTGQWEWVDTVGRRIGQPPLGSSGRADIQYSLPASNGTTAIYTFRWRYLRDPNTGESVITPTNPDQQLRNASDYYLANPLAHRLILLVVIIRRGQRPLGSLPRPIQATGRWNLSSVPTNCSTRSCSQR